MTTALRFTAARMRVGKVQRVRMDGALSVADEIMRAEFARIRRDIDADTIVNVIPSAGRASI
jgi:hypothetical protein